MNKAYERINWENYPSAKTAVNARNLNKIDSATDEIDNRVVALDAIKLDKVTAATMVKDVAYNESTGIFTITYLNGSTIILDTKLEKLAVNFSFDKENQKLIIILDDGTTQEVDLSALITEYEFADTDTIAFSVDSTGKVSAIVKDGSITEDKLQPNFLADVKVEVAKAQASATAASASEINAKTSETKAKASETASKTSETNAKASETASAESERNATESASAAATSEANASSYADTASSKADAAATSEQNAKESETAAEGSANTASIKAGEAATSAIDAENSATKAESYAHGGTGTRAGEDSDNAKYYYEQTKQVSQSLNGIIPQGTVAFADLPKSGMQYGDMYNISDEFVSDERFNDGGGIYYGAGNNVIWVSGDKWDVTAGSGVTGVKGNKETTYRQGNVNITPENIGALPEDGNAVSATKAEQDGNGNNIVDTYQTKTGNTNNNYVTFSSEDSVESTSWTDVDIFKSGDKHSSLFGKISAMFKNVRYLYMTITSHITDKANPHGVTKANVGLGNVDNTADADKTVKMANCVGYADNICNRLTTRTFKGTAIDNGFIFAQADFNNKAVIFGINGLGETGVAYALKANAANTATVATAAQYLRTFNAAGGSHGDSYRIIGKFNTNSDNRFFLQLEGGTHQVSVAHATYANSAGSATDATKMPKAGGVFTGAITIANSVWNSCGDDCYFGDMNAAGCMAFKSKSSSPTGIALFGASSSNMYGRLIVANNGGDMYLATNGAFYISNGTNTARAQIYASAFTQSSSRRVKENIQDMTEEDARKLLELNPVSYDYKNKDMPQGCYGLIAEDTAEIIPSCVVGDVNCSDDDKEAIDAIGIDYAKLVPHLIKMVQMQEKRIVDLESILQKSGLVL